MDNQVLPTITEIGNNNILDLLQDGYQLNFSDTNKTRQSADYCIYYDRLSTADPAQYAFINPFTGNTTHINYVQVMKIFNCIDAADIHYSFC